MRVSNQLDAIRNAACLQLDRDRSCTPITKEILAEAEGESLIGEVEVGHRGCRRRPPCGGCDVKSGRATLAPTAC